MPVPGPQNQVEYFGVPWESSFGYAQAVQVGQTIYVSGQFSHDEDGNFIGPARLDASGRVLDASNMELQMRTTYKNASRLLARFGATLGDVVEETIYVLDMGAAFKVAGAIRRDAYGTQNPQCVGTILETSRLAFPEQLVEISFTVVTRRNGTGEHEP